MEYTTKHLDRIRDKHFDLAKFILHVLKALQNEQPLYTDMYLKLTEISFLGRPECERGMS